jgi:hypothetical protein
VRAGDSWRVDDETGHGGRRALSPAKALAANAGIGICLRNGRAHYMLLHFLM